MRERFTPSPTDLDDHSETIAAMDSEATILLAFEHFGMIKPLNELAQPIDQIMTNGSGGDDLTERRENSLLAGVQDSESDRSLVQQRITEMLNRRRSFSEQEVSELWADCKRHTARYGVPPVLQFINDLRHAHENEDGFLPRLTEEAEDLAPDVYWIMLFEDEQLKKWPARRRLSKNLVQLDSDGV